MLKKVYVFCVGLTFICASYKACASQYEKVISLGGAVTEVIYALGQEKYLVGTDISSVHPKEATRLPSVGYYRNLPLEGLIKLNPDIILASEHAGPKYVLDKLKSIGVKIEIIDDKPTVRSLSNRINQIAEIFDTPNKGNKLKDKIQNDIASNSQPGKHVRALVLMVHSNQTLAAGSNTAPDLLLQLSGMQNILKQENGYVRISDESLAALAPDIIILTGSGNPSNTSRPGIQLTPAAQNNNIATVDSLLMLSIGPRIGESLSILRKLRNTVLLQNSCHKPNKTSA